MMIVTFVHLIQWSQKASAKRSTKFSYPSLGSAIWTATHSEDIRIPVFKESVLSDTEPSNQQQRFYQQELNDLNRDLNLSK